jgi:hypothetical protein
MVGSERGCLHDEKAAGVSKMIVSDHRSAEARRKECEDEGHSPQGKNLNIRMPAVRKSYRPSKKRSQPHRIGCIILFNT